MKTLQERFDTFVTELKPIPLPAKCLHITDVHAAAGGERDPLVGSGMESQLIEVLRYYLTKGYTLFKGGDWWDTWRGESLWSIYEAHGELVKVLHLYKELGCLYEILGNHEMDLCLHQYPPALIFEGFGKKIFLDHGHIGDWPNDEGWKVGRSVVRMANQLGIDPETSPHPENVDRHLAVQEMRHKLADDNPDWDFARGHTHYFENVRNTHDAGTVLNRRLEGYLIEEGNFIPLERR